MHLLSKRALGPLWLIPAGYIFIAQLASAASLEWTPGLIEPAPRVVNQHPETFRGATSLRVASYNIENFTDGIGDGQQRSRQQALRQAQGAAQLIEEIQPEVLLIEEIENRSALVLLNDRLDTPFPQAWITEFESSGRYKVKRNIALLSRYPVLEVVELDFSELEGDTAPPRGLLRAVMVLEGHRILVLYGVHLKSNHGEADRNRACRKNAMTVLMRDLAELRKRWPRAQFEVLVGGDMNTNPQHPAFADDDSLLPLMGWRDLWAGVPPAEAVTIPLRHSRSHEEWPSQTFDRFYASPELTRPPWQAQRAHVLQQGVNLNDDIAPGTQGHVSDHYPIYVDVMR